MPLNVFKPFGGDSEGFFQKGFRRQDSGKDSNRRFPSIRRQVLTRRFRRNDEAQEVILPVLPPKSSQNFADTNSIDEESYVEISRDVRDPSIHYAPSVHRTMPAEEYSNHSYEPSIYHFGVAPSAEDEYSDIDGIPVSGIPRYPMGGYSGRDMMNDPVHVDPSVIARTESMDSRDNDHYMEDGRRHPAFARNGPQPVHSISSSRSSSNPSRFDVSSPRESFDRPIRKREIVVDPYNHGHRQYEEPQRHIRGHIPDTYYIIPAGTNVIFQDEDGNEITRIGDFSASRSNRYYREAPLIVQDENGHEIYRTPDYGGSSYDERSNRVSYMDHYGSHGSEMYQSPPGAPNVILLDRSGRQIPLTNSSRSVSSGESHRDGSSYRTGYYSSADSDNTTV